MKKREQIIERRLFNQLHDHFGDRVTKGLRIQLAELLQDSLRCQHDYKLRDLIEDYYEET